MNSLHFATPQNPAEEFLAEQLAYAQSQIERLTRHLNSMRANLIAAGQTELAADALLAESSKPWRQFRKDYAFFHSLFARLERLLKPIRKAAPPADADGTPSEPQPEETKQQPIRVHKIGRNERCPCGSGKKYKACCLNVPKPVDPLRNPVTS